MNHRKASRRRFPHEDPAPSGESPSRSMHRFEKISITFSKTPFLGIFCLNHNKKRTQNKYTLWIQAPPKMLKPLNCVSAFRATWIHRDSGNHIFQLRRFLELRFMANRPGGHPLRALRFDLDALCHGSLGESATLQPWKNGGSPLGIRAP